MPVFYQDPKIENAAVFIANVVRNDDVYSSDKTMAEILKAYDEGKFVIFDVNDSGYHFIFTEGTIALTNRTPYQGVFIFGNAMASFSADNATTENNVDYFNMTLESSGSTLPETTEDDNGKVLKVQDGAWAIGDDESTPIEVYDSLDSVPDDLPDGSFVIIPSEEEDSGESDTSGGLTVVEITSAEFPYEPESFVALSETENAAFTAASETGLPIIIKATMMETPIAVVAHFFAGMYIFYVGGTEYAVANEGNGWEMGVA